LRYRSGIANSLGSQGFTDSQRWRTRVDSANFGNVKLMMRLLKKLPPPSDLGSSRDSVPCPTPYSLLRETRDERDTIPCPYSLLRRFRPVVRVSAVLNGDRKFKPHARVGLGTSKQTDSFQALSPSRCPPLFANQSMMPNGECLCRFACNYSTTDGCRTRGCCVSL
jgi:hypothetical protein